MIDLMSQSLEHIMNNDAQEVMSAYARIHASMYPHRDILAGTLPQPTRRIHFEQTDVLTVLVVVGPDYELFAAFDALVGKPATVEICQKLSAWIKKEQASLFVPV